MVAQGDDGGCFDFLHLKNFEAKFLKKVMRLLVE
jgi:hypothetical protein